MRTRTEDAPARRLPVLALLGAVRPGREAVEAAAAPAPALAQIAGPSGEKVS